MKRTEIEVENVASLIHLIRGIKVILDPPSPCRATADKPLGKFGGAVWRGDAGVKAFRQAQDGQAVLRNGERFPEDFLFVLNAEEATELVSQNVIPDIRKLGGAAPMAFTEQGVAMLSSVLRSPRAVEVNIAIMRTLMDSNRELGRKIQSLESKYDEQFRVVFDAIRQLLAEEAGGKPPRRRAGFHP